MSSKVGTFKEPRTLGCGTSNSSWTNFSPSLWVLRLLPFRQTEATLPTRMREETLTAFSSFIASFRRREVRLYWGRSEKGWSRKCCWLVCLITNSYNMSDGIESKHCISGVIFFCEKNVSWQINRNNKNYRAQTSNPKIPIASCIAHTLSLEGYRSEKGISLSQGRTYPRNAFEKYINFSYSCLLRRFW